MGRTGRSWGDSSIGDTGSENSMDVVVKKTGTAKVTPIHYAVLACFSEVPALGENDSHIATSACKVAFVTGQYWRLLSRC